MIITKKYALRLIREKKAEINSTITHNNKKYIAITRFDLSRTDHVLVDDTL